LLPRFGDWPTAQPSDQWDYAVRDIILNGVGVPPGWSGAISFGPQELKNVIAILFAESVFPGSIDNDLFVLPDNGRFLLQTDHHGVVHVGGISTDDLNAFVQHMENCGYQLPDLIPDSTFKNQSWMEERIKGDTGNGDKGTS
jgi:hypothetical protein